MSSAVTLPAILIALVLSAALVISIVAFCRTLLRRDHRRLRQSSQRHWRLAAALSEELRTPGLPPARAQLLKEDLYFLARAEAGQTVGRVRLREVLQESLRRCCPALEQEGYRLQTHEGGDPHVLADPDALGHAIDSLLRPTQVVGDVREIQIQLSSKRTTAALEITGASIDPLSAEIAKRIIEIQGGEVCVEGRAVTIRLPLLT